jgi:hypothetical protein
VVVEVELKLVAAEAEAAYYMQTLYRYWKVMQSLLPQEHIHGLHLQELLVFAQYA